MNVIEGITGAEDHLAGKALKGAQPLFANGFEALEPETPLRGDLRFGKDPHLTPEPVGSQFESLSDALAVESSLRYLQADTSMIDRLSGNPATYRSRVDFERMNPTPGGVIEAPLTPVDLSLSNPSASTSGCETSDFSGFPRGHIALVQRGTCAFYTKANNAVAAGAAGVIIFNQGTSGRTNLFSGVLQDQAGSYSGSAPVVAISFALGQEWAATPGALFRLRIDVGFRSNTWELKPVVRADAQSNTYWIRNATTGEVLYSGAFVQVQGVGARELELGTVAPDDRNGWWQLELPDVTPADPDAMRWRNVATSQYLATIVSGGNVTLLTSGDVQLRGSICLSDISCDQWLLDGQFQPETGVTRLRSSLGDVFLHLDDGLADVDRVKPGWPSAQWVLEPVPNTAFRRLLNSLTGDYLHVEYGSLEAGEIQPGWFSAMWELEPATEVAETNLPDSDQVVASSISGATGYTRFRNRWTGQLLIAENGGATTANSAPDRLAALWVLDDEPINVPDANLRALINAVLGQSPDSDILSSEAAGIYELFGGDSGINSIDGLEKLSNLRDLRLPGNTFLNTGPLSTLEELQYLDLSRNAFTTFGGLELNSGLERGDRIMLLQSNLGAQAPDAGEAFFSRRATVIPAPGLTTLQHSANGLVVDTSVGSLDMVDPFEAFNGANWAIEYDPARQEYFLRNVLVGKSGYLTWEDQNNNLEFIDRNNPEWVFEEIGSGLYRIRNTRLNGERPFLLVCDTDLGINVEVTQGDICVTGTWLIDPALIQSARDRALANFYDPRFNPPDSGFTRIQHTRSREFLHLDNGPLAIGQVDEASTGAQWAVEPVRFANAYFFAVRNRLQPTQYLFRDASGAFPILSAGPLPGNPPDGPSWATDPANAAFLFSFDGLDSYNILPLLDTDTSLTANAGEVSFVNGLTTRSFWRLDSAIKITAPAEPTGFIELQLADDPLYVTDYSISWLEPTGPGGRFEQRTGESAGTYIMSAEARDIRVKAICVGCDFFSDLKFMDLRYDRPPNICLQTRGQFFDPHYGQCDPTQGSLVNFASNAAENAACEILELVDFIPSVLEEISIERIAKNFIRGNFQRAQRELFSLGDMKGPDFSANCRPYNSMSFGAGASVGAFAFDAGGELGAIWDLNDSETGARSYTSTGAGSSAGLRLVSVDATFALGLWRGNARDFSGESIGVSLGANREIKVDLRKLKKLKKVGIGGGITLWYECGSGSGLVVNSEFCELREDSRYLGLTFDFSAGVDLSLPVPSKIGVIYTETCSPANFESSPGDCVE